MLFEWDEKKSESNYKKHSVRFEEAQTVFLDAHAIEVFDDEGSEEEDRFIRIGLSQKLNILVVVFCERSDEAIRIISARKATAKEKKAYEERI